MMKTVLIHVKSNDIIDDYVNYLNNNFEENKKYSKEVLAFINEFKNNNWIIYLTSIDNFDLKDGIYKRIYDVNNDYNHTMSIIEVNKIIDAMIIRVIGSVEGNFNNIRNYLSYLEENYQGLVINNPKAMIKGMTKHYLKEVDDKELFDIGIKKIPTDIYERTISYENISKKYNNLHDYIIKPVSGELSNSLANLGKIDEHFLRYKENKVLGWVVQPIMKEVWNGEYQIVFLNSNPIYAQSKEYTYIDSSIPSQKNRILHKYNPSDSEINMGKRLISYFSNKYNLDIYICRIDFLKDKDNFPILLEFEMVNPGFFIGYMDKRDNDIKTITSKIRIFIEEYIENKGKNLGYNVNNIIKSTF